jgi:hypothetical protein
MGTDIEAAAIAAAHGAFAGGAIADAALGLEGPVVGVVSVAEKDTAVRADRCSPVALGLGPGRRPIAGDCLPAGIVQPQSGHRLHAPYPVHRPPGDGLGCLALVHRLRSDIPPIQQPSGRGQQLAPTARPKPASAASPTRVTMWS